MLKQYSGYKIMDGRRMKKCPKCRRYKTGDVCMCGYKWQDKKAEKKVKTKNISKCKFCNSPGNYGGLCSNHFEQQAEKEMITRLEGYRTDENNSDVDILTGKVIPKHEEKLENGNDKQSVGREPEDDNWRDEIPF